MDTRLARKFLKAVTFYMVVFEMVVPGVRKHTRYNGSLNYGKMSIATALHKVADTMLSHRPITDLCVRLCTQNRINRPNYSHL